MNYWEDIRQDDAIKLLETIEKNKGIELNPADVILKLVAYYWDIMKQYSNLKEKFDKLELKLST